MTQLLPYVRRASKLACAAIYDPVTPNTFLTVLRVGETTCGLLIDGDLAFLVPQGTENKAGWIADFDVMPTNHIVLGDLHTGFFQNLPVLIEQLQPYLTKTMRILVTGHSKGAAEACLLGALLHIAGYNVIGEILFACPRPGFQKLKSYLTVNIPGLSFWNTPKTSILQLFGDPVPKNPPLGLNPYNLTNVCSIPTKWKRFIDIEWHMGQLYIDGIFDWLSLQSY